MSRAVHHAQQDQARQFYIGYLKDAAANFEDAITRLKHCEFSQCRVADATDMAHRIKGNAAMYGFAQLGLNAGKLEALLRSATLSDDHANALRSLINIVDEIHEICHSPGKSGPIGLGDALAAGDKEQGWASQSAPDSSGRKRILIAYQNAWLCDLMASLFEPEYQVIRCNSGKDAFIAIEKYSPDFSILEHGLEDISGLDLLKAVKASAQLCKLPVFLAFDPDMPGSIAQAISHGADGFAQDKREILEIVNFAKRFLNKPAQRILVVDDDPVVRELLKHSLGSAGMKVDIASDGLEALAYLAEETPDLILLDRFMPRLEGGTVLYEIQNKINLKSIPVLILTSMVNRGEAKSWFERGAADFIPKPFDPEEVLMRVKQHLETRQRQNDENRF